MSLQSTLSTTVRLMSCSPPLHVFLTRPGNHTAYKQVKGTKTTAAELEQLYEGLRQSNLTNFNVLLTGYVPSAEAVRSVGKIGRDIKFNAGTKPGSFFWGEWMCSGSGRMLTRQCLTPSWATTADSTFPRMKYRSTRAF